MFETAEVLKERVSTLREEGKEEEAETLETALKELEEKMLALSSGCEAVPVAIISAPLGGSQSYDESDSYYEAAKRDGFTRDQNYIFRSIFENIMNDSEMDPADKAVAVIKATRDFGKRVSKGPEESKGFVEKVMEFFSPGEKAVWNTVYINNLPDSAFAYVESDGKKDAGGKTVPRSLRHFPYKGAGGKVDLPHLRNALARAPQSPFGSKAMPKLRAAAEAAGVGEFAKKEGLAGTFQVFKDASGVWRWLTVTTNIFKDRDDEILSEEAHKKYEAYVDRTGHYPELRLWHVQTSGIGKADFVGFHDGFILHAGVFDEGKEKVAEVLAATKELAVSHGFVYGEEDLEDGVYDAYRTFEVSVLPASKAANIWTQFLVDVKEETIMPLTEAKVSFLEGIVGKEEAKVFLDRLTQLEEDLKGKGVDFKEFIEATEVPPKVEEKSKSEDAPGGGEAKAEIEEPPKPELGEEVKGLLEKITGQLAELTKAQGEQAVAIKELQRTDEEKIAAQLAPRQPAPDGDGNRPSQSDATKVEKKDVDEIVTDPEEDKNPINRYAAQLTGKGAVSDGGGIRRQ